MPLLKSVCRSLWDGFRFLYENWAVSFYGIISIASIYQIIVFHSQISMILGTGYSFYFFTLLFLVALCSLMVGAFQRRRIHRSSHVLWNLLGVLFAVLLIAKIDGLLGLVIYSILGGIAAGLCIPDIICAMLDITNFENRGIISGLFVFFVYLLIFLSSIFIASYLDLAVYLLAFKLIALGMVLLKPAKKAATEESAFVRHPLRVPALYMFVWFTFLLVDIIVSNMALQRLDAKELFMINLESVVLGLVAMILGGALMDSVGRRKPIIFAYLYLGIEYSLISLSSGDLIRYTFIDGVAWGILTTVFLLVIWGDLARIETRPLYVSMALAIALLSIYFKNAIPIVGFRYDLTQAFPLTSIFLFLSVVITAFWLPEPLPEKVIQAKDLRDYIETAKKIREKYVK